MFKSGEFVADHVSHPEDGEVFDSQIQPHGVELTIDTILAVSGHAYLSNGVYEDGIWDEAKIGEGDVYSLKEGYYKATLEEKVEIPHDHIGVAFGRSRLMRSGVIFTTAMWEPGYEGHGEVGLYVTRHTVIEQDFRPFQLALARADTMREYDGQHNYEGVDSE